MADRCVTLTRDAVRRLLARTETVLRIPLDPQPPSQEDCQRDHQEYAFEPLVSRDIRAWWPDDYDRLPKEPGAFGVIYAIEYVRDRCGQSEWDCPLGPPGTIVWAREPYWYRKEDQLAWIDGVLRFAPSSMAGDWVAPQGLRSKQGVSELRELGFGWRSAATMPRWMSRLEFRVTECSIERLHAVTDDEAEFAGYPNIWEKIRALPASSVRLIPEEMRDRPHRASFAMEWDDRYGGKQENLWIKNPWVWVIGFDVTKRVSAEKTP